MTRFVVDAMGNTTAIERKDASDAWVRLQTMAYDSLGNLLAETDAAGNMSRREYGLLERLTAVVDAKGHRTVFAYNARGQRTSVTNPDGRTMAYTRDALGRVTREEWLNVTPAEVVAYQYDGAGNLRTVTDAKSHTTVYGYDGLSRLTSVTQPGGQIESYAYDDRGRLSEVRDAMGHKIVYEYAAWSASAPSAEKHYATLSSSIPARTITYTRNELGDLAEVLDTEVSATIPMYTFAYDELNRVSKVDANYLPGLSREIESHYDRRGFRDLMRWREGDGTVRDHGVAVDTRGRVTAASLPGAQSFLFAYHANDLVKDVLRSNGTLTHYSYEPTGELKTASVSRASGAIEEFAYYYTPSGQMQARTDHEGTHSYGYTPTYRLAQVQNPAGSLLANEEFSYDAVGNRTNVSGVSYNVNNQMAGAGITFDANGNLTAKGGATFTWDLKNRLRTFDNGTDTQASYVYDPFGRRIKKTVTISGVATTTYFLWDGDQMIAEYNGSGALTKRYAYLGGYEPVQMAEVSGTSETIYDVHADHLDTPKFLTNQAGTVVWRAVHKAYGEAVINENPDGDSANVTFNFRFPGQYFDKESNLHYNRFRYYDTTMGRYITADPIGQRGGINVYSYGIEDPMNLIDLLGLRAYVVCRPLGLPVCGKAANHCFIVYDADYLGDPDATVRSFGEDPDGRMGEVSEGWPASDFSKTTAEADQDYWKSLNPSGDLLAKDPSARELNPGDPAVDQKAQNAADRVESGKDRYLILPPPFDPNFANSNAAAAAIANAVSGSPDLPNPGGRVNPGGVSYRNVNFK